MFIHVHSPLLALLSYLVYTSMHYDYYRMRLSVIDSYITSLHQTLQTKEIIHALFMLLMPRGIGYGVCVSGTTVLPLLGNRWSISNSLLDGFGPSSAASGFAYNRGQRSDGHKQVDKSHP